ncbi:hypothetical protein [Mycolicibacterium sp. J2]|uniref:hypothetical protein n=1 Tax=Mycolicibacterium sp. J2 TaxID=2993511 RepID=UPI00224A7B71|nr:hypothetical protein [Mycolicibacterium sp. J2]MCX2710861.1 hypothetical protein [Mycolicibacterium sp. J2]
MTGGVLSDEQIAAMTPAQRRDLIRRLQRPVDDMRPAGLASLLRRTHLGLMAGGAFFMVPWIVYLSITLPPSYLVRNWTVTWVGFDTLLVGFMVATAVLAWLHRQMLVFFAFTTGILLVCDAWFDVMTSDPGDRRAAVLTAVLGGLPLAAILIAGALSIVRLNAVRLWQLTPDQTLWRLPLLP